MYQSRLFARRLANEIIELIVEDQRNNIAFRHKTNSGKALLKRLNDKEVYFPAPRNADHSYVRSLYSSMRWIYEAHDLNRDTLCR